LWAAKRCEQALTHSSDATTRTVGVSAIIRSNTWRKQGAALRSGRAVAQILHALSGTGRETCTLGVDVITGTSSLGFRCVFATPVRGIGLIRAEAIGRVALAQSATKLRRLRRGHTITIPLASLIVSLARTGVQNASVGNGRPAAVRVGLEVTATDGHDNVRTHFRLYVAFSQKPNLVAGYGSRRTNSRGKLAVRLSSRTVHIRSAASWLRLSNSQQQQEPKDQEGDHCQH